MVQTLISSDSIHRASCFVTKVARTRQKIWRVNQTIERKEPNSSSVGNVVLLIPSEESASTMTKFGVHSPIGSPSIEIAAEHLTKKIRYFSEGRVEACVMKVPNTRSNVSDERKKIEEADALVAMKLTSASDLYFLSEVLSHRGKNEKNRDKQCHFALDCGEDFAASVGPFDESVPSLLSSLIPWSEAASGKRLAQQMSGLFHRWTSDDFTIALMLFFHRFSGSVVPWVEHSIDATWEKGPIRNAQEFYAMVSKCGPCILNCLQDDTCRTCLEELDKLDTRDQVASYRTIVSFESELLRDFSLCILQKNNIFGCSATIPTIPYVTPIQTWRGKDVTIDDARSLLVGHLDDDLAPTGGHKTHVSWKVAAGANVAYDQFPSQNQLFYPNSKGRDMWYDPVFRVTTIDGRNVWCKRHYKVRNGEAPGTFRLSVLDNGVTSNEFWTIAGAADDLSWIVFHYAGAAGAVGLKYLGGLLCTPDGSLPADSAILDQIWNIFRLCGIEPWELFLVNNDQSSPDYLEAGPPPLDFFRKDVLNVRKLNSSN